MNFSAPPVGPCCFTASQVALKSSHSLENESICGFGCQKKRKSGDLPNIQSFVNHVVPIFSNIQIFLVMTKKQKKWTCVIVKPLRPLSVIKKTIFAGLRRLLAFLERFHSWKKILWAPQLGTIPHAILDAVAHQ